MLKYVALLATLASMAHGQAILVGGCPSVNVMKTYDSAKMAGIWYPIFKITNTTMDNGRCHSVSLTDLGFGHLATLTYTTTANTIKSLMGANIYVGSMVPNGPAKYVAIFPTAVPAIPIPYNFLNTDYTTYAVAYFCLDLGIANIRTIHVYTRDKTPAGIAAATSKANYELDWYKIDRTSLVSIDQSCT